MFNFRIIDMPDGIQVIDTEIKTPMDALTPEKQIEYMEVSKQLTYSEIMMRKQRRAQEREQKAVKNPLHKIACFFGVA